MPTMSRRRMCTLIPVLAGAVTAVASVAQTDEHASVPRIPGETGPGTLGPARVISLEKMDERKTATGESWSIAHGTLATGETVNLHQSMQVAGAPPVQLHVIQHSEFILVREGELEFQHELDGQVISERGTPGSVIYIPIGTRHAVRNVGTGAARYFVVGMGGDAK